MNPFRTLTCVVILTAVAFGFAHKATAQADQTAALRQAQFALRIGQYGSAIEQAQLIADSYPLDSVLIIARASLELGQADQAERFAKYAIEMAPGLADARIMLGRAYLLQGRPRMAMLPLRRALDLSQLPQERTVIQNMLRQVQSYFQFRYFGGAGLVPSDNIGKATTAEDLTLGSKVNGLSGTLNRGETDTGIGFYYNLGGSYRFLPSAAGQLELFAQYSRTDYSKRLFDYETSVIGGTLTLPWDLGRSVTSFTATHTVFHKLGEQGYRANGIVLRTVQPLGAASLNDARHSLDARFTHTNFNRDISASDFFDRGLSFSYAYVASDTARWTFGFNLLDRLAQSPSIARREAGVTVGLRTKIGRSDWISDTTIGVKVADHDRVETYIHPEVRWERDWTLSLGFENPNISYYGFTPQVTISYLDRDSNHEFRTLESTDMFVGFKNAF